MSFLNFSKSVTVILPFMAAVMLFTACDTSFKTDTESPQASASDNQPGTSNEHELQDAPDFTLETMDGDAFTLSEQKGKVVVVNIWATWCPPCRKEIPDFIEIQDEMRDDDVLFLGVSIDEEGWEVVRPFADSFGINYPLVVDDGTISSQYGPFMGVPMSFIINKKGKVEHVVPGMVTKQMLQPVLQELATR